MPLHFAITYKGQETTHVIPKPRVVVGRAGGPVPPDLDLSVDPCVSRQHAVVEVQGNACWLTDAGSSYGTQVNGREIRGQGECQVDPSDSIVVGETSLRISLVTESGKPLSKAVAVPPRGTDPVRGEVEIVKTVKTERTSVILANMTGPMPDTRLGLLLELPLQFASAKNVDEVLQLLMQRVVSLIPAAKRGALLLIEGENQPLVLKASVSADQPVVSESLAQAAMKEGRGFIWTRGDKPDVSRSIREMKIENGMYAPLLWTSQVFGVVCVDSPNPADRFTEDDLRLLIAVAQYAAAAVANRGLQHQLQEQTRVLERLLTNFSPSLRDVLLEQARQGRLRPGGTRSEVSILFADLCGFTTRVSTMDTADTVEMLNDYMPSMANAVFAHNGVIDKYIGDAVLAVFGSPRPDARQYENAVRAASAMLTAHRAINERRAARKEPTCDLRVGIHCGEVIHGFIGAADRLEFTVVGDAVNRASRFCQFACAGELLISEELYRRVFNLLAAVKTTIAPKEGELVAYRVKDVRSAEPS